MNTVELIVTNEMVRDWITEALADGFVEGNVIKDEENGWSWYKDRCLLLHEGTKTHEEIVKLCKSDDNKYRNWLYDSIKGIILSDLCSRYDTLAMAIDRMDCEIENAVGGVYGLLWRNCAD